MRLALRNFAIVLPASRMLAASLLVLGVTAFLAVTDLSTPIAALAAGALGGAVVNLFSDRMAVARSLRYADRSETPSWRDILDAWLGRGSSTDVLDVSVAGRQGRPD